MTSQQDNPFLSLSQAIADRAGTATAFTATISAPRARPLAGILWQPDVVVTSEQSLADLEAFAVTPHGAVAVEARPAGRDPATNIALLRLAQPVASATTPPAPEAARTGELTLVAGATGVRMAILSAVGPAWDAQAGGHIDALLRLDCRFRGGEDGGPVVDARGALLGMATAGPRGRGLVIPHATLARVIGPLLAAGRVGSGWLGVGLQPVAVPGSLHAAAEQSCGLMVMGLAAGGPAEAAGLLPGDILLAIGGQPIVRPRAVKATLARLPVGEHVDLRLLRGGVAQTIAVKITARPRA